MNNRNQTRRPKKSPHQPPAGRRWPTYVLVAACLLMLVSGFFLAGRQHFLSMDYGMKNSSLRRQIDELEAEKKRLMYVRETALSPVEIKKSAKKTGLVDTATVLAATQLAPAVKNVPVAAAAVVPSTRPAVIKTASVLPVDTKPATAPQKATGREKPSRKDPAE